ncbi:MAG: hypothetical protein ACE5OV_02425 [Candidatus Bathyarchaeia archaeon]
MPIDVHVIAIILMEGFGAVFFLSAFMLIKRFRGIGGKLEALQEALKRAAVTGERRDGPCYSYKWAISHTMKPRKMWHVSPFLIFYVTFLIGVVAFTFFIILSSVGYALFISLIGAAILFETDAFEAYSYGKAVQKVELDRLSEEDQSYMEIAREALGIGAIRFILAGVTFAVAGPYIRQIFNSLCYALASYMNIFLFQPVEASWKTSQFLAMLIATILPGILLYLPELMGKTLLRKIEALSRRMRKR